MADIKTDSLCTIEFIFEEPLENIVGIEGIYRGQVTHRDGYVANIFCSLLRLSRYRGEQPYEQMKALGLEEQDIVTMIDEFKPNGGDYKNRKAHGMGTFVLENGIYRLARDNESPLVICESHSDLMTNFLEGREFSRFNGLRDFFYKRL